MTTTSFTGTISASTYTDVETLTSLTLTEGKAYTIQIQNIANLKIADAEFTLNNTLLKLTKTSDDWYIKANNAVLTILENV